MNKKNKILIVTNVQTKGNPALWFIYNGLAAHYEIYISGNEKKNLNLDKSINYGVHSWLYTIAVKFKFFILIKTFCYITHFKNKEKRREITNILTHKFRLFFQKIEFNLKAPKVDFILNIDTEAAFISMKHTQKYNLPSAYFIYEFYADQFIENKDRFYTYRIGIEEQVVKNAKILLGTCNDKCAEYLINKYYSKAKPINFTICPAKTFSDKITLNKPLKFYYHGYFFENRGLVEGILAMKEIDGAEMYLRGFGYLENKLRETVSNNQLENKVFFLEPVPTLQLSNAGVKFDIGLTMSRQNVINQRYAAGFKAFENISAGLALIIPESFPLKKLNEDYTVGMTYKDATTENLAQVFQYCVNNPEDVKKWKRNARDAYEKEFNPDVQIMRLINEIQALISLKKN